MQQSPCLGLSNVPQDLHAQKNRRAWFPFRHARSGGRSSLIRELWHSLCLFFRPKRQSAARCSDLAEAMTRIAERIRNITSPRATPISGQFVPVNHTAPAATKTERLDTMSFLEHSHTELMSHLHGDVAIAGKDTGSSRQGQED